MKRLLRWYGAGPLNLLALLACFALAGYAAAQFVPSRPVGVLAWFLGAVIGHDLLLVPLYSLADRSVHAVLRHRAPGPPAVAWVNYVRVPAALSGLLLLVWFPLILRLTGAYQASTTLSPAPYLWHWLAVTGALFLLSAVAFAFRLRGTRPGEQEPGEQEPGEQDTESRADPEPLPAAEPPDGRPEAHEDDPDERRADSAGAQDANEPPSPGRLPVPHDRPGDGTADAGGAATETAS